LIQSKKIDEEEHAVFFYHIKTLNNLIYWVNKNVAAVKSMLIEIRKKNVEINNFYNVIINEKTKYQIKYEKLKKRIEELEQNRNNDENENVKSLNVFIESIQNASIKINVSVFVMTTINIATSKKLSDSLILIDDKNPNIEDWLSTMKNKLKENADWFLIETSKKTYVRTWIDKDAMNI
jgi:predicted nuclease with TOPRIM domain